MDKVFQLIIYLNILKGTLYKTINLLINTILILIKKEME